MAAPHGRWTRLAILVAATAGLGGALWWCVVSFGWGSPLFGALANWCVVSYIAVTATVVHWRVPTRVHRLRAWERDGTVYRRLGVGAAGTLIRRTPLRSLSPTLYLRGRRDRIAAVLAGTEDAEAAHWWAALLALPLAVAAAAQGAMTGCVWLLLFNIVFNVYPALLQRLVRSRLLSLDARALLVGLIPMLAATLSP